MLAFAYFNVNFNLLSLQSHVVAAFEQSLTNMTSRLQNLTHTAEQKVKFLYTEFLT